MFDLSTKCPVCFEEYDEKARKPMQCPMCPYIWCAECIRANKEHANQCAVCKKRYTRTSRLTLHMATLKAVSAAETRRENGEPEEVGESEHNNVASSAGENATLFRNQRQSLLGALGHDQELATAKLLEEEGLSIEDLRKQEEAFRLQREQELADERLARELEGGAAGGDAPQADANGEAQREREEQARARAIFEMEEAENRRRSEQLRKEALANEEIARRMQQREQEREEKRKKDLEETLRKDEEYARKLSQQQKKQPANNTNTISSPRKSPRKSSTGGASMRDADVEEKDINRNRLDHGGKKDQQRGGGESGSQKTQTVRKSAEGNASSSSNNNVVKKRKISGSGKGGGGGDPQQRDVRTMLLH